MSDFSLTAQSPLGGYNKNFGAITLGEVVGLAIVSIATPIDGKDGLTKAVDDAFSIAIPDIGFSNHSKNGEVRLLGLQRDQMFLVLEHDGSNALALVTEKLGGAGYYTDQSDSWTILRIAGPGSRTALERICMLDLNSKVFLVDAVSRTNMEHLSVIILRDSKDSFLLMSPRSSAHSFIHAVETSITNIA